MEDFGEGPLIVLEPEGIEIPPGIVNLTRFRAWSRSDGFTPKSAIATRLGALIQEPEKGFVFIDRARFAAPVADLSVEPDVLVVLVETLDSGRARLIPSESGPEDRYLEIEGTVDLVVECVSKWSVNKDKVLLREAYHKAAVREYWLTDVRGAELSRDTLTGARDVP